MAARAAPWTPGPAIYDVGVQQNVEVVMDDGVVLRVDVKYPVDRATGLAAQGPFPSLLTQNPYGKNGPLSLLMVEAEDYVVQHGYIAVIADVRGRGGSTGYTGFWDARESKDGVALAQWASQLPNANGKVGLYGGSYLGITQLLTSAAAGPNSPIKAAVPEVAVNNAPLDSSYGGMPNGLFGVLYIALFGGTGAIGVADYIGLTEPVDLATRTLSTMTQSLTYGGTLLNDFITGGPLAYAGPYWDSRSPGTYIQNIPPNNIATLLVGGWYDVMGKGPMMNYVGLQNTVAGRAKHLAMTPNQPVDGRFQMVVGPWTHTGIPADIQGQLRLRWFDRWLKGIDNGVEKTDKPIHFNILGTDRWVDASVWPLKETTSTVYYFGERGTSGAISLNDGQLVTSKPSNLVGADSMLWTGVSSPCSVKLKIQTAGFADLTGVPIDQYCGSGSDVTTEVGALTYTTEPFASPKVIAGPIGVTLYASSTTTDAEFVVNVERVKADGTPVSIQSGALLGSLRGLDASRSWTDAAGNMIQPFHPFRQDSHVPLVPLTVNRFEIGVWPTAFQVNAGERLRFTVSTSDIPFALPTVPTIVNLVGGIYSVQRNSLYASKVTVPMANPTAFTRECSICRVVQ
ncbi:MAG: CocE/NonD family hydrolase [Steroidobacteraceae bacterium]